MANSVDYSSALEKAKAIAANLNKKVGASSSSSNANSNLPSSLSSPAQASGPSFMNDNSGRQSDYYQQQSSSNGRTMEEMKIPAKCVGFIIGRGGEILRGFEQETRTNIKIWQENEQDGNRRVVITGMPEDIAKAKRLIQERVDVSDRPRDSQIGQSPYSSGGGGYSREEMAIPASKVGYIIGKQASTLKDIQAKSGAKVFVPQDQGSNNPQRLIQISGHPESIEKAKNIINELLNMSSMYPGASGGGMVSPMAQSNKVVLRMDIPQDAVGVIIGKGGETIRALQQYTQCHIKVDQPIGGPRTVIITADSAEYAEYAKQIVQHTIDSGEFVPPSAEQAYDYSAYYGAQQGMMEGGGSAADYAAYYQQHYGQQGGEDAAAAMAGYQQQYAEYMRQYYEYYGQYPPTAADPNQQAAYYDPSPNV